MKLINVFIHIIVLPHLSKKYQTNIDVFLQANENNHINVNMHKWDISYKNKMLHVCILYFYKIFIVAKLFDIKNELIPHR